MRNVQSFIVGQILFLFYWFVICNRIHSFCVYNCCILRGGAAAKCIAIKESRREIYWNAVDFNTFMVKSTVATANMKRLRTNFFHPRSCRKCTLHCASLICMASDSCVAWAAGKPVSVHSSVLCGHFACDYNLEQVNRTTLMQSPTTEIEDVMSNSK